MLQGVVNMTWKATGSGNVLAGFLQHIVTMPSGDGDKRYGLGVVADLLNKVRRLLDNFVKPILGPLNTTEQ
jgi:hypothetical protein